MNRSSDGVLGRVLPLALASGLRTASPGVSVLRVEPGELNGVVHALSVEPGARLADLFAFDEGPLLLELVYALDREGTYLVVQSPVRTEFYSPLSDVEPAAFVEECEIYERFGVRPDTGKPLNRVLVAPGSEQDFLDLRQRSGSAWEEVRPSHLVRGEAFEFPFGPVRGAGLESLYTGLVTNGEELLDLYLFYWHKHRGIERRLVGLEPARALFFVERMEGLSAVTNAWAFSAATEAAAGIEPPPGASATRAIAAELERVYNHAAALAALCQATGLSIGQAAAEMVLEQSLRLNLAAFGHRYLFGVLDIGGVRRGPDHEAVTSLLPPVCQSFREVADSLLRTNSFVDRLEAAGIITAEEASRFGLVGPLARASGWGIDSRRDHPRAPYASVLPAVATRHDGDVYARMQVMVEEVRESEHLIDMLLGQATVGPATTVRTVVGRGPGSGLGWAESPRGESLARVVLDETGRIRHARLRPAAVRNWRAYDDALRSRNVFTDVPIIEASFWLTVAGAAR